ncbi:MAG TPA: hypothetical protein VFM18_15950, partial [Methanosarcina sp.]|nr:hypothetical protein [Methanosarcina sp.]
GTITPVLTFGGSNVGMAYSVQYGRKTKIGQYWHVEVSITLTAKGTSTGYAQISGLPASANVPFNPAISIGNISGMTGLTGTVSGFIASNTGIVNLFQTGSTGVSYLTDSVFTNTSNIQFNLVYQ